MSKGTDPNAPLSLRGHFTKLFAGLTVKPALHDPDMARKRLRVNKLAKLTWPASGATYTAGQLGEIPVEWVAHPASGARCLLYTSPSPRD